MMDIELALEPAHTRCLSVAFEAGDPGSVRFRADILDLRKSGLMELGGRIATAGIIHNMVLRGAFAIDTGEIERIDWEQSHVMHDGNHATKGECCRDPMDRLGALVGVRFGDDFRADLKACFGGPLGCTHVNTLFQELGATVVRWQTLRAAEPALRGPWLADARIGSRSIFFDAFLPEEGGAATLRVRLTDAWRGPLDDEGNEMLSAHEEVRLAAEVEFAGWQLNSLQALERSRRGPVIEAAAWRDRSDELVDFVGRSLGGGMARSCADRFDVRGDDAFLLAALLCLAPGMTQVGVALSESLAPSPKARPAGSGSPLAGPGPCYLLRSDGPLIQVIMGGGSDTD